MNALEEMKKGLSKRIRKEGSPAFASACDPDGQITIQLESYERLVARTTSGTTLKRFLSEYDACMRLAECLALSVGSEFGQQPHRALRIILATTCPHIDPQLVRRTIEARHASKKASAPPDADALEALSEIHRGLRQAVLPLISS